MNSWIYFHIHFGVPHNVSNLLRFLGGSKGHFGCHISFVTSLGVANSKDISKVTSIDSNIDSKLLNCNAILVIVSLRDIEIEQNFLYVLEFYENFDASQVITLYNVIIQCDIIVHTFCSNLSILANEFISSQYLYLQILTHSQTLGHFLMFYNTWKILFSISRNYHLRWPLSISLLQIYVVELLNR